MGGRGSPTAAPPPPRRRRSPSTAGASPGSTGAPSPAARAARPTPWAAGNPASRSSRIAAIASSGRSPTSGGRRSIRVRNSYSRNSRTTSWRSYSPTRPRRRVQGHVDVAHEPHQLAALEHGLAVLLERSAQLLGRDLVECAYSSSSVPQVAISFDAVFSPTPGDARDVVGRVALERLVVEHLVGPQPPPLLDLREVVGDGVRDAAAERDHQLRVLADELEHVQVAGEDRRVEPEALGLADERGDRVVRLEPLLLVLGDAQRADDLLHLGDLLAHVVGHAGAGGLVLGVAVVAERARREVEGDRDPVGLHVLDRPQHDVREPEHGGHELALGRRQGLLDEGEVAAVDEPVAVEQQEAFHRLRACGVGLSSVPAADARSCHGSAARPCPPPRTGERLRSGHALSAPRRDHHRRRRQPGPQRRDPGIRQGRDRLRHGGRRVPGRVPRPGRGPQDQARHPGAGRNPDGRRHDPRHEPRQAAPDGGRRRGSGT